MKKIGIFIAVLFLSCSLFAKASARLLKVGTETFVEIEDYKTIKSFNVRYIKMVSAYPSGIVIFVDRNYMNDIREEWTFQIDYDDFMKVLQSK